MGDSKGSPRNLLRAVSILLVLAVQGCASAGKDDPMWWRQGVVLRTMRRSEVPKDLDSDCIDATNAAASGDDGVAAVNFRAGRAPYTKAFLLPAGEMLKAGDRVFVEPGACRLRVDTHGR